MVVCVNGKVGVFVFVVLVCLVFIVLRLDVGDIGDVCVVLMV